MHYQHQNKQNGHYNNIVSNKEIVGKEHQVSLTLDLNEATLKIAFNGVENKAVFEIIRKSQDIVYRLVVSLDEQGIIEILIDINGVMKILQKN